MSLRDLDDRVLPAAARSLRQRVEQARRRAAKVSSAAAQVQPAQLQHRYGGTPVVGGVLRRPAVSLGVVGLVLLAAFGVAVWRGGDHGPTTSASHNELLPQGDAPHGDVLGPAVGDRAGAYVERVTNGLIDAIQATPGEQRVALVSLTAYRTPAQTAALLSGFTVRRAFLRATAAGRQAATLPVEVRGKLLPDLQGAFASTAKSRAAAQKSYQGYVNTLRANSTQDKAFRDLYAAFARSAGIEATAYGHLCACVYALLVTASPTQLLTLQARPGVRAIEVAKSGLSPLQVQVQPLLPEVTGVVPHPGYGGVG